MYVMIPRRCSIWTSIRRFSSEHQFKKFSAKDIKLLQVVNNYHSKRYIHSERLFVPYSVRMTSTTVKGEPSESKTQNKLAFEKSPYLLQHATNPVHWFPWGDEAIEKARREDKLIFLSVGYSTCHWCHVMERESFENPEIARVMNQFFVNVKVDREERPDIDKIYMTFIQAISGHGGWPMSVFLTPELTPVTGGTYFPPVDKYGQPGFKTVLTTVAHKWIESRSDVLNSGNRILEVLKRSVGVESLHKEAAEPSVDCGLNCVQQLAGSYDNEFGGFTDAPKFPQPVNLNFLFHAYSRDPSSESGKECLNMCLTTLTKMANGGIHDHIGQGFSRYSVDGKWHVPHFEKMLYDQAQLLRSYADAFVITKDTIFADIVDDIVTYVTRDLRHQAGGFYNAEDADSLPSHDSREKKEGAFYVWTYGDIKSLLGKPIPGKKDLELSDLFAFHYNVKPEGNVGHLQDPHGELKGQNVLIVYGSLAETAEHFDLSFEDVNNYLQKAREILYQVRLKRPRPHLDDKIVTSWNGLIISGLSRAGFALNNKNYIEFAVKAAAFVERYLFDAENGLLLRSCYNGGGGIITQTSVPINGFHGDYCFMVQGLLDLYEATLDTHWLEFAEKLQDIQDNLFWDPVAGGYFATTEEDRTAILRLKDDHDGAEPSSNSIACRNLLRLNAYLDHAEFNDKSSKILIASRESLTRVPAALPELVSALLHYHDSMTQIYVVGKKDAADTTLLLNVIREKFVPGRVLLLVDHQDPENILFRKSKVILNMKSLNNRATVYVCHRHVCSLPVTEPDQLARLLDAKP
ncbi:spermatogenesis-associated protein 20 isoform X1 [Neodiprion fabricii]|uniref:spermatogenesis-associated protein 20 isoform X1 n=2 Tax=Neodiprion fabricii TaxID=2872261 RepID=UPI001ED94A44|nr:spermatogenesis-associated protein 20 isoform X1 [Neodiprion fabricii]XP_046422312.1 spermatogenesis-associated protein 20 isoform X1 [Neodiprion fabricii]XP_046422313.1 spermatogenesis-associated protein 20 isoform X1 [Neodiprion fabricii]